MKGEFNPYVDYFAKAATQTNPVVVFILTAVNYLFFPEESYKHAAIAVTIAVILDILTKYYAVAKRNGGFRASIKTGALSSRRMWEGAKIKLIDLFVILLLAGLSARVTMVSQIYQVSVIIATAAYIIMFLREAHSVVENLVEAGHHDMRWFLIFLGKKHDEIVNKEGIEEIKLSQDDSKDYEKLV